MPRWRVDGTHPKEVPYDMDQLRLESVDTPESPLQALMEARPGVEPNEDRLTLQIRREVVAKLLSLLDHRSRWILDAVYAERMSLRPLGKQLGLSHVHVWRVRVAALARLEELLVQHPIIRERLGMTNSWDHHAFMECVDLFDQFSPTQEDLDLRDQIQRARVFLENEVSATPAARGQAVRYMSIVGAWALDELIGRMDCEETDRSDPIEQVVDLLVSKQHDYGHGNILAFGLIGVLVRMSDKVERFYNLELRGSRARNETLLDTLQDLAGYAVIARMLLADTFKSELASDELVSA